MLRVTHMHRALSSFRRPQLKPLCKMSYTSYSEHDELKYIQRSLTDFTKKPNQPWGFSIYRCSYKDDHAWHRMLQLIQQQVKESVELMIPPGDLRTELLQSHNLVIHDQLKELDGATSHEVRDHFNLWVTEQLPGVISTPEMLQRLIDEYTKDPEHQPRPEFGFGTRLNFALFVDDICLESLFHTDMPVVKLMCKQWGNLSSEERKYTVHPEWHDGVTEMDEEDVGWMYMNILEYVETYDILETTYEGGGWYTMYVRPPRMMNYPDIWKIRSQASGESENDFECTFEDTFNVCLVSFFPYLSPTNLNDLPRCQS